MSNIDQSIETRTFEVTQESIDQLINNIKSKNIEFINNQFNDLNPSDAAELLSNIPEKFRVKMLLIDGLQIKPEVIIELNNQLQKDILNKLPSDNIADIVNNLESDNALQVVTNLNEDKKIEVFEKIPTEDKNLIEEVLKAYPEGSAARIMQTEYCAVPKNWSVGETIDYLRETEELPKEFLQIFVVDENNRPLGSVSSSRVLRNPRDKKMQEIMDEAQLLIHGDWEKEQVGYLFEEYNLVSAGVIDKNNKLIGMITADDILTVLKESTEEDAFKLADVQDEEITDSAVKKKKKRFIWLTINLFTAVIASYVIGFFDGNIEKVVALAILMPIVASMGGNAATQTLTVTVRLIATKSLTSENLFKIINKEFFVGFFNGILFSFITGLFVYFWFYDFKLSLLIGVSMIINMACAGFSGIAIPVILDRFKIDPAVASTVFVTTVTDVVGFVSFLGLAGFFLGI